MNKIEKEIASQNSVLELVNLYKKGEQEFNIIKDFKSKKVVEYLTNDVKSILIIFIHGLGDTIMFLPIIDKLRKKYKYKNIKIDLLLANGQEAFFDSIQDNKGVALNYDYLFYIDFPWVCNKKIKKGQYSAANEFGISIGDELPKIPHVESPIVLLHFCSTSATDINNCDYETAKTIWNEVKDLGKIPMECHFIHQWHNWTNKKYDFIDNHVRDIKPEISTLVGLISNSYAFLGVPSGPLCVSAAVNKNRTACLQQINDINCYISMDNIIDINNYKEGDVYKWLSKLYNKS